MERSYNVILTPNLLLHFYIRIQNQRQIHTQHTAVKCHISSCFCISGTQNNLETNLQMTLAAFSESQTLINFDIMKVDASIIALPSAILN